MVANPKLKPKGGIDWAGDGSAKHVKPSFLIFRSRTKNPLPPSPTLDLARKGMVALRGEEADVKSPDAAFAYVRSLAG